MNAKKLALIGGGNMGEALLGGLLAKGWCAPEDVVVVEYVETRGQYLRSQYGVNVAADAGTVSAEAALIAVKPHHVQGVCESLGPSVRRVLSVAAGVTIASMEGWLAMSGNAKAAVVRSMPNTPAMVGMGASGLAGGTNVNADDVTWAKTILESVGVAEVVPEWQLDAVTGIAGSGVAYLFLVAEAMIDGGVLQGLPRSVAVNLVSQTIRGAGEMLLREGDRASTLRTNVTSPGGTTAAGLRALEERATRGAFINAVAAATERSIELGKS